MRKPTTCTNCNAIFEVINYYNSFAFKMNLLITNIGLLVNVRKENNLLRGAALSQLPCIENAFIIIDNEKISAFGKMDELHTCYTQSTTQNAQFKTINANGAYVLPCWCDSHTHLVFAASREEEFVDKIKGLSYADIAAKGGGILNSANKLNAMSENELFELALKRLNEIILLKIITNA